MCRQCLEVSCRDAVIQDRYGEVMDRTSMCKDVTTSVKVKITDTCDCTYGPNAVSNARWCCGDYPHLDVSQVPPTAPHIVARSHSISRFIGDVPQLQLGMEFKKCSNSALMPNSENIT